MVHYQKMWKHGNSVVVTIPAEYVKRHNLEVGNHLAWEEYGRFVMVRPARPEAGPTDIGLIAVNEVLTSLDILPNDKSVG